MPIEPSDPTIDLTYVYTTSARLIRYLGSRGVEDWSSHDDTGIEDDTVVSDSIYQATAEINLYLLGLYNDSDLYKNSFVVDMATRLAACRLCSNRGNDLPQSLADECEKIIERLEKINAQHLTIPGVPLRADMRPTLSNRVIDRRYAQRSVRVERSTSTTSSTILRQDLVSGGPWYGW